MKDKEIKEISGRFLNWGALRKEKEIKEEQGN